ncbi:MAG: hypothetical protein AAGD01_10675 [Acidobacteriota bacterium]
MSKKQFVKDNNGDITHVRVTSKGGRSSWLYDHKPTVFGDGRGKCVEVADHHKDGTTTAYEFKDQIFGSGKGKRK